MRSLHLVGSPRQANALDAEGRRIEIRGTVQGVGFRPWVFRIARQESISGYVRNHTGGVTIEAHGSSGALQRFLHRLSTEAPAAAVIDSLTAERIPFATTPGFQIVKSERRADRTVAIPPDLPTCRECLAEVQDRWNRRYRYPFTNCTACGPRFTITSAAPYDRPNTTMAPFRMCPSCQEEYDSIGDRRFHAQPNACPVCGPNLEIVRWTGEPAAAGDVIARAGQGLLSGLVVAIKSLGGFHLACDAMSDAAVARLRERKRRDEKPFAVMVRDLAHASSLAVLTPREEQLLESLERPIVLAPRREPSALSAGVAPRNPLVGIFLPYTPLHHMLLEAVRRPLVMTSGNLSDEPIVLDNDEARRRLGGVADLLVVHNREIVTRCDDSVARVIAGAPVVLRRSRGYVPRPIQLAHRIDRPVLACGGLLKNAFCMARGHEAVFGPHIGDLEKLETFTAYRESIARLEQFLDFEPDVIAHDLHPDYLSTRYALGRAHAVHVPVQHHHAHVASLMAEHGLEGPVIGVAYDGTGLGTDGTAWGGEILVADFARFTRVATFRPIPLPGGDTAIRQPWRVALAALDDAFEGDAPLEVFPLFARIPQADIALVRQMVRERVNTPLAHGAGRYFDAVGALGLERVRASYEGQIALEWNAVADAGERGRYRYEISRGTDLRQLDLRATVRDAAFELIGGEAAARVSARFHNTLAAATADLVRGVARTHGRLPVALSGGCFQNARLAEGVLHELTPEFKVHLHSKVPPGDGGLALGQAVVADAVMRNC